jgi:hypothetical protein
MLATAPFLLAAGAAPALLSLAPTAEMLTPLAEARALAAGAIALEASSSLTYAGLVLAADLFADAPGRVHLLAKALAAALIALAMAYVFAVRFPALAASILTTACAAFIVAPFSGAADIALAMLLVAATALLCEPAGARLARAHVEGAIVGTLLFLLWTSSPILAFAGFLIASAAPAFGGRLAPRRLAVAVGAAATLAALLEAVSPGFNLARALAASSMLAAPVEFSGQATPFAALAACTAIVIALTAIFGGREFWRSWSAAALVGLAAASAALLARADPAAALMLAAAVAAFSRGSPFYAALFEGHDRASIATALAAALLTLFWGAAGIAGAAQRMMLQQKVARSAPVDIRTQLALVQPGAPTLTDWIADGRFSTPEARQYFAPGPADQSVMLLEAGARARALDARGMDVAILTGGDAACVIAARRDCRADGARAADLAKVVFVPRLDLDPATKAAKGRAEALLYTEFRLVERDPYWEVWVRRGASLPAEVTATLSRGGG